MKFKAVQFLCLTTIALLSQAAIAASTGPSQSDDMALLDQVQQLVRSCVVRTYTVSGTTKVYGSVLSNCPEVRTHGKKSKKTVEITLGNEKYFANLNESADSDGGDLDDIEIKDSQGATVARLNNVLAFGDILLGLAGANVDLPEVYDQSIALE